VVTDGETSSFAQAIKLDAKVVKSLLSKKCQSAYRAWNIRNLLGDMLSEKLVENDGRQAGV